MRALVTGVSGQDGFFMARRLLQEGFRVLGLTSDEKRAVSELAPIASPALEIRSCNYATSKDISQAIHEFEPDLIFNFASLATGQGMFDDPHSMNRINGTLVLDILEAVRVSPRAKDISICQASSSEMYGTVSRMPQDEETPFRPQSPYGAAKLYAHNLIGIYRKAFGLRACSAILFNHESVRRSPQFVTKKIAQGAARIKLGLSRSLQLGNLTASRDWGCAIEYMDALYQMARAPSPVDYVVASGRLTTVGELVRICFDQLGLDPNDHIEINPAWVRPIESLQLCGNPARIREDLGWVSRRPIAGIMLEMVEHEMQRLKSELLPGKRAGSGRGNQ
jgi:GDPmannose 4,6-dehydratase